MTISGQYRAMGRSRSIKPRSDWMWTAVMAMALVTEKIGNSVASSSGFLLALLTSPAWASTISLSPRYAAT